jgi:hypothetical protein
MPPSSPEALARRAARANERRRERRAKEKGFSNRETRRRSKRRRASGDVRATQRAKARAAYDGRPFVGCDGEGIKIGDGTQSHYALFRMGDRELYNNDQRLTTAELLRFIVEHPSASEILVGFAFDYDVSNILRDLAPDRLHQLLRLDASAMRGAQNPYARNGGWTWVKFGAQTYGLQYIPRNYFKVCIGRVIDVPELGEFRTIALPGSVRTIYETWGFFQGTFLAALARWNVGADHVEAIKAGKDARDKFVSITRRIKRYCAIECDLLAELMTVFRTACLEVGIRPRTWNGAGKLASALMRDHGVLRSKDVERLCPAGLLTMAHEAYYGGRFEVTRCGLIDRPVHEHDINSAYPDAMQSLPCLEHGKWRKASGAELARSRGLFVAPCHFQHPRGTFLCGLPIRSHKDGRLSWPRQGRGVYWSPEIRSARELGAKVSLSDGWLYEKRCDCRPFEWVEGLYEYRRKIGKAGKGQTLRLGYNSIYGKWAQRIGHPPFANPIYAGLCTSLTRAKLNKAIVATGDPRRVLMLATDGIYTIGRRPKLTRGEGLGQWEHKRHAGLFIVRPGLYWPPKPRGKKHSIKSRGLSAKYFEPMVPRFRRAWAAFMRRRDRLDGLFAPVLPVRITTFVGARLALHLNKPALACQWITRDVHIRFESDSGGKRQVIGWQGGAQLLGSLAGDDTRRSATYQAGKLLKTAGPWEDERLYLEAQPDPIDMSPPFVDA